ncbi:MarR family transcriptional regulator [Thermococcus sp. 21S7]|uniref:helix-turn-helix transcriptional regulator n=1 Tax=Thermococcus sp. 21S7 TaxID=1638221 RepID=UPI00143B219F|nr:MarR family transcriptional regulator [Thermococcus sp. 21S7]NJE60182.1 MarR family transcriptional regulator [Thermococcus sp. 21S7]
MPAAENQKPRGRKPALIGLFLILSLIFLPLVSAGEYDYEINAYGVYFEVIDQNSIRETVEIDLTPYTNLSQYVIYTAYPVENASAVLDLGNRVEKINVTVREVLGGTNAVYMTFPTLREGQSARIGLTFTTRGMISENGGNEQFTYYIKFSQPVGVFHMQLLVPRGYAILSPIIPSPDRVESSTDRLLLEWKRSNVRPGDEFYFIVGFSGEITVPKPPSPWLYVGIFLAGLLIGGGSVYGYILYRERKREEELTHLRSDEERILALLREGPVLQSELAQKLGVSKAKVSIILREMEEKGLITRTKEGRTYRVFLKE